MFSLAAMAAVQSLIDENKKRMTDASIPMIYDIYHDKMRPVTQADVDQLVRVANVWEGMQRFVEQKHDELVAAIPTSPNIGHG